MVNIQARRLAARGRDPRLLAGIVLILGSALLGAWLISTAGQTERYWSLAHAVHAGDRVSRSDLVAVPVALPRGPAERYLSAADEFPADLDTLVWGADQPADVLVSADALALAADRQVVDLPLPVEWGSAPDDLAPGDRVVVWAGPAAEGNGGETGQVLPDARVTAVGGGNGAAAGVLVRTVVVAIDPAQLTDKQMARLTTGRVTLVRIR